MDPNALAEVDRQIAHLKKELNALIGKRISILHDEIKRSEAEAQVLHAGPFPPSSAAKAKKPRPAKTAPPADEPPPPAAAATPQPKASPPLPEQVSGEPEPSPEEPKQPARRPSAGPDATVQDATVQDALREAGLFGLTQAELGEKTGLTSSAVAKALKSLPGITRKGAGKDARFYWKG